MFGPLMQKVGHTCTRPLFINLCRGLNSWPVCHEPSALTTRPGLAFWVRKIYQNSPWRYFDWGVTHLLTFNTLKKAFLVFIFKIFGPLWVFGLMFGPLMQKVGHTCTRPLFINLCRGLNSWPVCHEPSALTTRPGVAFWVCKIYQNSPQRLFDWGVTHLLTFNTLKKAFLVFILAQ